MLIVLFDKKASQSADTFSPGETSDNVTENASADIIHRNGENVNSEIRLSL